MGNLYSVENSLYGDIWDYFDLGENIVCVNAIGENIQQRLNGCDYDSDSMLITDDEMLIERVKVNEDKFKVPFCAIKSSRKESSSLALLDHNTSANKIGDFVNLSQKLNSIIWDKLSRGEEDIEDIYCDVCKLAVLSGIEIDKAKRAYDSINAGSELARISQKYGGYDRPGFFEPIDEKNGTRYSSREGDSREVRDYFNYNTTMQYIYDDASTIDFRQGKPKSVEPPLISDILKIHGYENAADCAARDKIVAISDDYRVKVRRERSKLPKADPDESDAIYENIANLEKEQEQEVLKLLTNTNILALLIEDNERKWRQAKSRSKKRSIAADWQLYGPLLDCDMFLTMLQEGKEKLAKIEEVDCDGEYNLYSFSFNKTFD